MIELLERNLDYFRAKPVNIPKSTILLDHGYHPDKLIAALQQLYPQIMTKIRFDLAPKPTKAQNYARLWQVQSGVYEIALEKNG